MTCAQLLQNWHKLKGVSREIKGHKPKGKNTMNEKKKKLEVTLPVFISSFSHDVTAAMLVFQNNETAAILVFQTNRVGIGLFLR